VRQQSDRVAMLESLLGIHLGSTSFVGESPSREIEDGCDCYRHQQCSYAAEMFDKAMYLRNASSCVRKNSTRSFMVFV
jgi:hypothetical protein